MGGVDLADMLISLYRIKVKASRWYVKVFWHLLDISKVNAWNLYRCHFAQYEKARQQTLCLLNFCTALENALKHANKPVHVNRAGRPSKRPSCINSKKTHSKCASVPTPCLDIRYYQTGHWLEPVDKKDLAVVCAKHIQEQSSLCLLKDRNCFKDFHHK